MIELYELRQLVAFAEAGTLSKPLKCFTCLSQPSAET